MKLKMYALIEKVKSKKKIGKILFCNYFKLFKNYITKYLNTFQENEFSFNN